MKRTISQVMGRPAQLPVAGPRVGIAAEVRRLVLLGGRDTKPVIWVLVRPVLLPSCPCRPASLRTNFYGAWPVGNITQDFRSCHNS